MKKQSGFTLIEALIVVTLAGIIGLVMTDLLYRTFRGANKTYLIGNIKQNGQTALNIMESNIRFAKEVTCISTTDSSNPKSTVLAVKSSSGKYIVFRYYPLYDPTADTSTGEFLKPPPHNGFITQEEISADPSAARGLCNYVPGLRTPVSTREKILTDRDFNNGVSVSSLEFKKTPTASGKDLVSITFTVSPPTEKTSSQRVENQVT